MFMRHSIFRIYRTLFQRPTLFFTVVTTMALGIGANSAIFSVIDAILLKPLPYPGADRLMAIFESNPQKKIARSPLAPVRVEEWNRLNRSFTGIAAAYTESFAETSGTLPERLVSAKVSPRFFSVLGTPPLLGRGFTSDEDQFNGPNAAVISERLWQRRFHRDPHVIGKILRTAGGSIPIVGVAPDSFRFPEDNIDLWRPAQLPPQVMRAREARWHISVGRLREGMSPATALADLANVQTALAREYPATDAGWAPVVEPLKEQKVGGVRRSLWLLFGAVSLVLLIACANVACLLLAQAVRRTAEIAVRFSLGATRQAVVKGLLLEALCASLPGAVLGLILAGWGAAWFRRAATGLPRAEEIQVDWRIVLFTFGLTMLTAIVFGLFPAFRATADQTAGALVGSSRAQVGGRQRALRVLVSGQIALAIVLLVGAGLLIRTLSRLGDTPLGFKPERVLALRISGHWGETNNTERVRQRLHRTLEQLRDIPGVEAAAITASLPGGGQEWPSEFRIVGRNSGSSGEKMFVDAPLMTSDYFRVLDIPMLAGELCRPDQTAVLVNRSLVERYFGTDNPVGREIQLGPHPPVRVFGVVADVREHGYSKDPTPIAYTCALLGWIPDPHYLLRTAGDPAHFIETVRRAVQAIEPSRAVYGARPLSEYVASSLAEKRFQTMLLSMFGATALLLAMVGLYGVMTFLVSQRTREIGLRMALGAQRAQILRHVFGQGALMAAAGGAAGLLAAAVLARFIASLLFGVTVVDPVTFIAVSGVLAMVAGIALWAPARRAARVDPMTALRQE
jgi:putative ABC transport system permease protein